MHLIDADFENRVAKNVLARPMDPHRPGWKSAAVLLGMVRRPSGPHIIFTKRTMTVATHKGQISLPGGMEEPTDQGPRSTALREAEEEIGLPSHLVEVVGFLEPGETITGFWVTPVVGFVDESVDYQRQPDEVEEVFEVSVADLLNPHHLEVRTVAYRGETYLDHRFTVGNRVIWGATGKIVAGFMEKLRRP